MEKQAMNELAFFVLSHNSANKCQTYDYLRNHGIKENVYVAIDADDKEKEQYLNKYPEKHVLIFDKKDYSNIDTFTNRIKMGHCVYARNACYDLAEAMGFRYFIR